MDRRIVPYVIKDQDVVCLKKNQTVSEAVSFLASRNIGAVIIADQGRLEGIFTERDLTARVIAKGRDPHKVLLADVMSPNPITLSPDDTAKSALELMRARHIRHLPVVDEQQNIVGIVSIRDLYATILHELEQDVKEREAFIFNSGYVPPSE